MRHALLLTAALALLPAVPSFAQAGKKAPAPPTTCTALARSLDFIEATADTRIEEVARGCSITDFYVGYGPFNRYRIAALTIQSSDLFAGYAEDFFPADLDLNISGLIVSPDTGSLLNNYLIEVQSQPMDLHLAYRWDRHSGDLDIADLSVKTEDNSAIRLAARVSGLAFDPASMDELTELPGAFDHLAVQIDDARFFSSLLAPAVIGMLPYDEDPRILVRNHQETALALVGRLPDDTVSAGSKAALTTLIKAFPKVRGDFTFDLRADPGLELKTLDLDDLPDLLPLLARLQLAVTHTPAEQP